MATILPGVIGLYPDDVDLFMQGAGANASSYSHWMKWNLPSLTANGYNCLPRRATFHYEVKTVKEDAFAARDCVLWTNSNVSWTSGSSLATLKAIYGDGGFFDFQIVREARSIASTELAINIAESADMPEPDDVHMFDITDRIKQIYLANSLGACQITTRHVWGALSANLDTSVAAKALPATYTEYYLQQVTKPASTKLYDGWSYQWDDVAEQFQVNIGMLFDTIPQVNDGARACGGFN